MGMATALIEALKFGLSIWNTKESNKFLEEVIYLERERYEEENKLEGFRNMARIDNIDYRLRRIAESITHFKKPNS